MMLERQNAELVSLINNSSEEFVCIKQQQPEKESSNKKKEKKETQFDVEVQVPVDRALFRPLVCEPRQLSDNKTQQSVYMISSLLS